MDTVLTLFRDYKSVPGEMNDTCKQFCELAEFLAKRLPDTQEGASALRNLLATRRAVLIAMLNVAV